MKKSQSGFTLVEIAIVLVIIGLLLGGVLKGQEMIENARIKSIVNDMNGVSAAYNSYMDRFHAIPGDETAVVVGRCLKSRRVQVPRCALRSERSPAPGNRV